MKFQILKEVLKNRWTFYIILKPIIFHALAYITKTCKNKKVTDNKNSWTKYLKVIFRAIAIIQTNCDLIIFFKNEFIIV